MTSPPFDRIGKFEITDLIGEGAMGTVYRAWDPVLGRHVAVKLMSQAMSTDDLLRDRFLREARAAGSLQHPNIVTIFDLGDVGGHLYIAMEYIEGADLEEIVERGDPLSLREKLDVMVDVLRGLEYAHGRGVVHRDIKPANIRIAPDGRARIMDFGIAHLAESKLTQSGALLGTPHYMAPEQVTGDPVSAATDVFAVGAVLYELLAGNRPFPAATLHAVLYKVVSDDPVPLEQAAPDVPGGIVAVVNRALTKDPAGRFPTARAMVDALQAESAALPAPTSPGGTSVRKTPLQTLVPRETMTLRQRRRRLAAGGGGALLVGTVLLLLWSPWGGTPPAAAPDSAATAPAPGVATAGPDAPPDAAGERTPEPSPVAAPRPRAAAPPPAAPAETTTAAPETTAAAGPARDTAPPLDTAATAPAPPPAAADSAPVPAAGPDPEPEDPRPAIEAVLARYARAIEAGDLDGIRAVYPGVTQEQAQGWVQFFAAVTDVTAPLAFASLAASADTATGEVRGRYLYTLRASGRTQEQPVSFTVRLALRDGAWRIVLVR